MKLAIVGNSGGTNIGASLQRAAAKQGHEVDFFDALEASRGPRWLRALAWRLGRKPLRLASFSSEVARHYRSGNGPAAVITTGAAPLQADALRELRARGTACVNYSTDDPWSAAHRARWHLEALPEYDVICTPRRANIADFLSLGCKRVEFVPFGYDDELFARGTGNSTPAEYDVLYVGGADAHRVEFATEFLRAGGPALTLVGDYWERYPATAAHTLGHRPPAELARLTRAARINLCLVRRMNRDGHVMRSLEAAALGACMLVEDTAEHRDLFGPEGDSVCYFRSPHEASRSAAALLRDPARMQRLADSVHHKVTSGAHTYGDRLKTMLSLAAETRR